MRRPQPWRRSIGCSERAETRRSAGPDRRGARGRPGSILRAAPDARNRMCTTNLRARSKLIRPPHAGHPVASSCHSSPAATIDRLRTRRYARSSCSCRPDHERIVCVRYNAPWRPASATIASRQRCASHADFVDAVELVTRQVEQHDHFGGNGAGDAPEIRLVDLENGRSPSRSTTRAQLRDRPGGSPRQMRSQPRQVPREQPPAASSSLSCRSCRLRVRTACRPRDCSPGRDRSQDRRARRSPSRSRDRGGATTPLTATVAADATTSSPAPACTQGAHRARRSFVSRGAGACRRVPADTSSCSSSGVGSRLLAGFLRQQRRDRSHQTLRLLGGIGA